jgi:formylglycine-generating enzyme required for sulfatase activity
MTDVATINAAISQGRDLLALNPSGRPVCTNWRLIVEAIERLVATRHEEAIAEILHHGFLRDSPARYEEHVAPTMRGIGPARFVMGTDEDRIRHFCGESPSHLVELSPFRIADVPVTFEQFCVLDPDLPGAPGGERRQPVVGVTWFDATLFALWMGCRLPTEAEWEFACAAGSQAEWCCAEERGLVRHAWYSENSQGRVQPVATREPNALGLFDFHGNVWEWCIDDYHEAFYAASAARDPVNLASSIEHRTAPGAHKVCRGGSMHALPEMCRTRYRFHDPAGFWAADLGFRLAAAGSQPAGGRHPW